MPKASKRILSVTVKQMADDSPDTSWLGEYGNSAESEFAIDREHATDCQTQTYNRADSIDKLERVHSYLDGLRIDEAKEGGDFYTLDYESLEEAQDIIVTAQEELEECDCDGRGDRDRNEYQYFNPNHDNYAGLDHAEIVKYCLQDYKRMESGNHGDWSFIGIRAIADVQIEGDIVQEIKSGGLWGIESDSGDDYIQEVSQEELHALRNQLESIGFSKRAVSVAFKNVKRKSA